MWDNESFAWSEKAVMSQEKKSGAFETGFFESESRKMTAFKKKNFAHVKSLKDLASIPKPGEMIKIVTKGSFSAFSFIELLAESHESFEECYLVSYNFGEQPIDRVFEMHRNNILRRLSIVISESIRFRMPKRFEQLSRYANQERDTGVRVAAAWNHAKIILMKSRDNNDHYVVEGSGNFSDNAFIEQYNLENSIESYGFHKDWIEKNVFSQSIHKRHFIL